MPIGPKKMPFLSHLAELRQRLLVILVVIGVGSLVAYSFTPAIVNWLFAPAAEFLSKQELYVFGPFQAFMFRFKVAGYAAIVLTSPIWLYQVLAFFLPALKPNERKYFLPTLIAIIVLFIAGNLFCHYVVVRPSFEWLMAQNTSGFDVGQYLYNTFHIGNPSPGFAVKLQTLADADKFLGGLAILMIAFGLTFELPVLLFFLLGVGIVKYAVLRRNWRYVYLGLITFSTMATPDWSPVTIGALLFSVVVLYELTMLAARVGFAGRIKAQAAETAKAG
jgi:sec-independent protein translocase protein TatC